VADETTNPDDPIEAVDGTNEVEGTIEAADGTNEVEGAPAAAEGTSDAERSPAATDGAPVVEDAPVVDGAPVATEGTTEVEGLPAAAESDPAAVAGSPSTLSQDELRAAFGTPEEPPAAAESASPEEAAEPRPGADDPRSTGRGLGTGRRKEAVARVRLVPGEGRFELNGRSLEEYFPARAHRMTVTAALRTSGHENDFDVFARLHGGGVSGQAGALQLGIARALIDLDGSLRPALKAEGMLTRDAREKERRKYGLKKARKAPQYSKR
jgi:small subunit ribosomal protein S9